MDWKEGFLIKAGFQPYSMARPCDWESLETFLTMPKAVLKTCVERADVCIVARDKLAVEKD